MQSYALKEGKVLLSAEQARRYIDYRCPECGGVVRLRGGEHRRLHFFHLTPSVHCRQNGKSATHLAIQTHLQKTLMPEVCHLEVPFPSISRIADVVWEAKKTIFEIQCSPISADEIRARNRDYGSCGYQVIWILHDRRFNRFRLSPAEVYLGGRPYFFTNMDARGRGMFYTQEAFIRSARRLYRQSRLPVDIRAPLFNRVSLRRANPLYLAYRALLNLLLEKTTL